MPFERRKMMLQSQGNRHPVMMKNQSLTLSKLENFDKMEFYSSFKRDAVIRLGNYTEEI